jgi:hypothetical protein
VRIGLEEELETARATAAASMLSDSVWRQRHAVLYEQFKQSEAEVARLRQVDAQLAVAMADIAVFCDEIVRRKWELAALTSQLSQGAS